MTWSYDADGNRTSQADGVTTITTTYDTLGRVLTETRPLGTTTYTWDSAGNLVSVADSGGSVGYGYDQVNLPTSVTEPGGKLTTLAYDNDYQPTTTTLPNGVVTARTYASGRLTRIAATRMSTVLASSDYSYTTITPPGEPARDTALVKTVLDHDGNTTSYGYDTGQGFLTSAVKRNGAGAVVGGYEYAYAYDLMGNRTSDTVAGVTTSSLFNDANQLTSRGTTSYTYDLNGNQLSNSAGAAYSYNAKNQSTSLQKAGGSAQTQAYAGATQFERIEKAQSGTTTQFGESILGMLIRKEGSPTYYTRLPDGELLSQRTPSGTHYYLTDGLGTIVAMSDDSGTVNARYSYDPYGQVLSESGPYNPWRFKSGYQSQTTDHYKFGHRWYDPSTGRWTQLDPLEQPTKPGDWNRYGYVGADPVNGIDPDGLWLRSAVRKIAGGVLIVGGALALAGAVALPIICGMVEGPLGVVHCIPASLALWSVGLASIYTGRKLLRG